MIGGAGNLPSKMARTKSRPDIDAITCVGVTPYSTSGTAVLSSMKYSCRYNYDPHTKGISPNRCVRHMISHHAPDLIHSCVDFPGRGRRVESCNEQPILRHCERSEAIHRAAKKVWIASSLSLSCANASRLSSAMTSPYARLFDRISSANRLNR